MKWFKQLLVMCVLLTILGASVIACMTKAKIAAVMQEDEEDERDWQRYTGPMTIAASFLAGRSEGNSWSFSVNSEGEAAVRTDEARPYVLYMWDIEEAEWLALLQEMEKQKFLDLNDEYGKQSIHSAEANLAITLDRESQIVKLMDRVSDIEDKRERNEAARFMKVFKIIEGWVDAQKKTRRRKPTILDRLEVT